ncbi:type II toxin-antitoxin system HipA family toxin [Parashewanella tropica]|uniref:type II toxin-antitoxin system HipA family toxin n=1 Tax=Parashewanella tropica TaxID=2547970 RepID=UPI0010595052|nr:type II toxin-antitoxin system HipA family toxin [Parashewanella tropica]
MVKEVVTVKYQNTDVGTISFDTDKYASTFEYDHDFIGAGIELSPIEMPLSERHYSFSRLNFDTYKGLPGLLSDSFPDDFGNKVLNSWLLTQNLSLQDITPIQRLKYIGTIGMGALEYTPELKLASDNSIEHIDFSSLISATQQVLNSTALFEIDLNPQRKVKQEAIASLLSVGISAGGARPKAIVAFNNDLTQVCSGHADIPDGFTHYLMKFDGVTEHNKNQETYGDPLGFGAMEYVYHLMATRCGIDMMPCSLFEEGSRRHFITQRFDRDHNHKIHVQSLNAIAHVDYKKPGSFSYNELFDIAKKLELSYVELEQLLRRMIFNIVARNHDDHSKNFAFMLNNNKWALAPAYDLAYSYKPNSIWVNSHWMSLNGKRDRFNRADFYSIEKLIPVFDKTKIDCIIDETIEHVSCWRQLAKEWEVPNELTAEINSNLRLYI